VSKARAEQPDGVPTPAIGYIRVSMAREEMISPELQRKSIQDWARAHNRHIVDWVEDLDATGRNFKRKIMKAIAGVESGVAREIAVWKYSRFGRDRHGNAVNIQRVELAGGQLQSATEQVDARTAMGRFQRGMLMEFAAFESDRAGEQWKETFEWRRDHGLPAQGGKRFGYIWHPRCVPQPDGTFRIQQEKYVPDPELAPVAEAIYRRYVTGDGFTTIAHWLNDQGILNGQGRPWSDAGLKVYLDSGFAAGYLRIHDPMCTITPYKSHCPNHFLQRSEQYGHEAIIGHDLWQQYLGRRSHVKAMPVRSRKAVIPLSGLVRCVCGGAFRLQGGSHIPRPRMTCVTRQKRGLGVCDAPSHKMAVLESEALVALSKWAREIEATAATVEIAPDRPQAAAKRERLARDVEALERAIKRHLKAYAMATEDDPDDSLADEFRVTLSDLRRQKAEAAKELAAESRNDEVEGARTTGVKVALGLMAEWDTITPEKKNALLRRVVSHFIVDSSGSLTVIAAWEK
jgi:site-specific DNA recombinase